MTPETIAILGSIFSATVGGIVWFVKETFKRQNAVTDRYFQHLEERNGAMEKERDQWHNTMDKFANAIDTHTASVAANTESTKRLADAVAAGACQYQHKQGVNQ